MELFPDLRLGWLNGWIFLGLLCLVEGTCFLVFPKDVVKRLFDRSGWSQKQVVFTVIGKVCALVTLILIVFTPLKLGTLRFHRRRDRDWLWGCSACLLPCSTSKTRPSINLYPKASTASPVTLKS